MTSGISIFFPMFNEEANIRPAVAAARKVLGALTGRYEIIIVDDGSGDRTGQIADALAAAYACVRVLHHERNRGLGAAIRSGLAACTQDIVVYTDGDLPCDLHCLAEALPLMAEHDVVLGYRITRRENLARAVYSRVYNALIRALFGIRVRDVNFALKVFRREVVQALDLRSEGSFIDVEILAELRRNGFHAVGQIPVVYTPRVAGVSTLARPQVIWGIFVEMYRYWRRPKRPTQAGLVEDGESYGC